MNLGEILVTLYKIGSQIVCGLNTFDRIVVSAKEAVDLVKNDVWEDHPDKAAYVALPEDEKKQAEAPHGCGLLTTCVDFTHDQIEALTQPADGEKKPAPAAATGQTPKAPKKAAAPKKAPKQKGQPPAKEETQQEETKPEDDTNGNGEGDHDNGNGSEE